MVSIRGTLVSAIYQKSLRISAAESEESAAVTLMSTDVEGVGSLVSLCYDTCAVVLEVGFGIGVLTIFVGAASIFTGVTALSTYIRVSALRAGELVVLYSRNGGLEAAG